MIKDLHEKLINKKISAKELTQDYLDRIKNKNSELNAFITVTEKEALRNADEVDKLITQGKEVSILAGVPASIKDVIMTAGVKTTAASKILENYIAPYDASLVKQLKEQQMVLVGKNNCDEFAQGSSTENSAFGPTKNPTDPERVPGGSSGGSAAAVAADMSVYSIGTDTGGSVRQPAAFCGTVGFKPTYGAISRFGLIATASSLDQAGILAKSVEDVKIIFNAIRGGDNLDSTCISLEHWNTRASASAKASRIDSIESKRAADRLEHKDSLKGLRIGVPKEYFIEGMDEEIEKAVKKAILKIQELGAEIVQVSLPHTDYALSVYYIIMPSEVSANLARYDGIRYGQSCGLTRTTTRIDADKDEEKLSLIDYYKKNRADFLGDEVKRRIMLGTYALSAGYFDAYYKKAQQIRTLIKKDFEKVFTDVDLLITPVTPTAAWKLGEKKDDPLKMYLQDIFTVPVNVAGLPALSLPVGKTAGGLPIGAQIIGQWWGEEKMFETAGILESVIGKKI